MGDHEGWAQPSGLLPGEIVFVTRHLDQERWTKAEERTAELIACIQPNRPSEERRTAVAKYVESLIHKCFNNFNCQVFTFGSVPLKTYLPDGDIDLTAFSEHQALKDTWANEVRDVLESEEKSERAEFHVKEVQYIQAEVKLIKCLVENIVVDISFNQLGGLCTLCFLEQVDHVIGQNYLFKRSIILVKAWCYYESRILGAHHGLISTYALETLVLYIFHVFNKSFSGPLEVLYRFLAFFSNFDWDNYCVSLWGPIPLSSLPDMTAEPPRKDEGKLHLEKFFEACHAVYAVYPGGQDNQGQSFVAKHFNVVDPLRTNNNLGRSVSKGNFFRIRSAFGFGARKLARILECPKECIISEIDQFFMNTWERHGSGQRPDAPSPNLWHLQPSRSDSIDNAYNRSLSIFNNDDEENTGKSSGQIKAISDHLLSLNLQGDGGKHFQGTPSPPAGLVTHSAENNNFASSFDQESLVRKGTISAVAKSSNISEVSKSITNKYHNQQSNSDQSSKYATHENRNATKTQKGFKGDSSGIHSEEKGRFPFARPRSSPELTGVPTEISTRVRRNKGEITVTGRNQVASVRVEHGAIDQRRRNMSSDSSSSYTSKATSVNEPLPLRRSSSQENIDSGNFTDTPNYPNIFSSSNECQDADLDVQREDITQPDETVATHLPAHQNMQDPVNLIGIPRPQFVNRQAAQIHLPMNFTPVPVPISPSVLASMAYAPANLSGMVHTSLPVTEPAWGPGGQPASYSNLQFPQGPLPPALPSYVPNVGLGTHAHLEDSSTSDKVGVSGSHHEEEEVHYDPSFWQKVDHDSQLGHAGLDMKSARGFHLAHSEPQLGSHERPASPLAPAGPSPGLFLRGQNKLVKDVKELPPEGQADFASHYNPSRFAHDNGLNPNQIAVTTSSQEISSPSMAETAWNGAAGRVPKLTKDKRARGRGNNNGEFSNPKPRENFSSSYGKSNSGWQMENTMDGTHVGDEASDHDKHIFGAANAVSLDHRDHFLSSLHGSRSPMQTTVPETALPVTAARNIGPISSALSHVQHSVLPGYDPGPTVSSDSVIPGANLSPGIMGQGARERSMDNAGVVPFTFYPIGPPFPFLTMVPLYNFPTDGVSSGESLSPFEGMGPNDDSFDNRIDQPEQCLDTSYDLGESSAEGSPVEHRDEMKSHILHSDFISHWYNLQYGRFCQNPRIHGPVIYPSPMVIPPIYLQGHFPLDGPGRPFSSNTNMVIGYGHRIVPVASLQPNSNRRGGNLPCFNAPNRCGTGTYLPNPRQVPYRDRQSSGSRGNRGSYGQDRNDHGDRDAGLIFIPKNRGGGRGQNKHDARNQTEKSNSRGERNSEGKVGDRVWDSHRHDNFRRNSFQLPPAHFTSGNSSLNTGNFMAHGSGGMSYGMYPLQPINANGNVPAVPGNGPAVRSVVMLYPYDQNMAFTPEALEFGSLGPVQYGGTHEGRYNDGAARLNDGRFFEQRHNSYQANSSPGHSPSDQPSSPKQHQRSSTQRSYQLKEEDFPPLSFRNQSGRGGTNSFNTGNSSNSRGSHYQAFLVTPSS